MSARKIQGKPPIIGATVRHGAHGKVDLNEVVRTGNRRQRRAAKSNKRMRAGAPTLEDPALGPPKEKGVHTMDAPTPDHEADKADTATGTALLDHVLAEVRCVGTTVACELIPCSIATLHELIKKGEIESFLDGKHRRVTLRSIIARRDRLLAEGNKAVNSPPRGRGRPRKSEIPATTTA